MTEQAKVAKHCRAYLRSIGVKGSVTSKSYAGGENVRIYVQDQHPKTMGQIKKELAKYQYGSFNPYEDIYENGNLIDGLPQVKFLFIENDMSDDMYKKVYTFVHKETNSDLPVNYDDVSPSEPFADTHIQNFLYRVMVGGEKGLQEKFWAQIGS